LLCADAARADDASTLAKSGSAFLEQCSGPLHGPNLNASDKQNAGWCYGYLMGMVDFEEMVRTVNPGFPYTFCLSSEVTLAQLGSVAVKYMRDHPTDLNVPTGGLVVAAFTQAFPCAKRE
jgi:hypothetical protein